MGRGRAELHVPFSLFGPTDGSKDASAASGANGVPRFRRLSGMLRFRDAFIVRGGSDSRVAVSRK